MTNNFDSSYPEFKSSVGIYFSTFDPKTKNLIVAEWALCNDWEKVWAAREDVLPFENVPIFKNANFHTWLLANQDARAFPVWEYIYT